ncbi:MAG: tetratricopeptide repeat protein [Proteobacteria bacterium]|nr:tetratricopeptide repeat protein [Pseudomonadota bacterium]MBU1420613.1 tetratricopeptide repeat protein [Pseudomonadota bacterium]MBU1456616.1 tetratricopeptide repeat protein [Pseudomonadota bacterium]
MLSGLPRIDKKTFLTLVILLGIALALRLFFFDGLMVTAYGRHLLTDEQLYHYWAKAIAEGRPGALFLYDQAPLPACFLAGLYGLFHPDPFLFRVANIIFGLCTCFFLYLIGSALGGRRTGLISCGLAAFYAPSILYNVVPLKTSMALFLLSGFLALLSSLSTDAKCGEKLFKLFGMGILLGLLSLVRSNGLILICLLPPLLVILFRPGHRLVNVPTALVVFVLGMVLTFSPFWYLQSRDSEKRSFSSSQLGRNFYYGNGPENPTPYYHPMPFASSVPGESSVQFIIEASRRSGRDLTAKEASSFWFREVLHYFIDNPGKGFSHLGLKLKAMVSSFEAGDHYSSDFLATLSPRFGLPLPGFAIIFALGIGGLAVSLGSSRLSRLLVIPFFLYSLSLLLFYLSGRYRIPLAVFLIPWAAVGISNLIVFINERKWKSVFLYLGVCAVAVSLTQLPFRGKDDFSLYYNVYAALLNSEKKYDKAIQYWEKSVAAEGSFSPLARLHLAGKYYESGRRDDAFALLDGVGDDAYVAFSKYGLLGDIFAHEGKKKEAIDAYLASLEKNSGQRRIRKRLIQLYFENPDTRDSAMMQVTELKRIEKFFQP